MEIQTEEIAVRFPPLQKIINESFVPLFYNQDRYLLLWGGRGSSKSNFAAKKIIYDCLNSPYYRFILIRETYASIKDSQYQTIKDIVNELGLHSLFSFRENPLEIRCVNGNIIYARGCDDVDKIKSIKDPSGAWYEEANNIKLGDFITITTSIRTTKAAFLQEILTFNPEFDNPEEFWIDDLFLKGETHKLNSSHIEIKLPSDEILRTSFTSHHSTYTDNRWCSKGFIAFLEQLRTIDPYYYDVYCLGIRGQKKAINPFASHYDPAKHESTIACEDRNKKLFILIDFNLNPFAISFHHIWRDTLGDHHHVFHEHAIENGNMEKMIQYIRDKYGYYLPTCSLSGDAWGRAGQLANPNATSFFEQLRSGLRLSVSQIVVANNPTHEISRSDVNYYLLNFPDFKINPEKCPGTCSDMRSVQCDIYGQIIKRNRKDESQRADFCDCLRYSINSFQKQWIENHRRLSNRMK